MDWNPDCIVEGCERESITKNGYCKKHMNTQNTDKKTQTYREKFPGHVWPTTAEKAAQPENRAESDYVSNLETEFTRVCDQRDELLAACKWLMSLFDEEGEYREQYQDQASVAFEKAETAIAKAEGK